MKALQEDDLQILVNGTWRPIPRKWWNRLKGPKPYVGFQNDGCTVVRDDIRGYAVWPACVIHDWHYSPECPKYHPNTAPGFHHANVIFGQNTYRILRLQGMNRFSAAFYAAKRFTGVTKLGRLFFRRKSPPFSRL